MGFFIYGVSVYKDYGISYDESFQIDIGNINYKYITQNDQSLLSYRDRYYGPITELFLIQISKDISPSETIYRRHLATFLIFFTSCIVFFFLGKRLFHSTWWGFLCSLFLIASPRILANSFYNSKDIPFLSSFIFAFYSMVVFMEYVKIDATWGKTIVVIFFHSTMTAISITNRIPGIFILVITELVILFLILAQPKKWKKYLSIGVTYTICTFSLTVLFWPILWHAPFTEFYNAFVRMSDYPSKLPVFYRGNYMAPKDIPWHYLPTWMLITTPIVYTIGFFIGNLVSVFRIFQININKIVYNRKSHIQYLLRNAYWIVIFMWAFLPATIVILLRSNLYDSWRHMFFIYPAYILVSILGFYKIYQYKSKGHFGKLISILPIIIIFTILADPIQFLVKYHPFGNVYFNSFAGEPGKIYKSYDMDYWGLSYKQAIDYILNTDSSTDIHLFIHNYPGVLYVQYMLPKKQFDRIKIVNTEEEADYFLSEYRWHWQKYAKYKPQKKYFSITVDMNEIMVVFKL